MRLLAFFMVMLMIVGIMGTNLASCRMSYSMEENSSDSSDHEKCLTEEKGKEGDADSNSMCDSEPTAIPSFVKKVLVDADWLEGTVCVIGGKTYYRAYENYERMQVLYNEDKILVADPTLRIEPFASDCDHKFYVSVADQTQLVDFTNPNSLQALNNFSHELSSVIRYRHDTIVGVGKIGKDILYSMEVDFPKPSVQHADKIGRWLANKIIGSQAHEEEVPKHNAFYIGYTKQSNGVRTYKGNVHDHKKIAQCVSNVYFAKVKAEWGTDEDYYPPSLSSILNLRARMFNKRFVTYQSYTYDDNGGAHAFYTEKLMSFDHVHNREIDFGYLFKPNSEKEVLDILLKEAQKTRQYKEWNPNIEEYVIDTDEDEKPTGGYNFPQPGLSEEGIVFSFQPYAIHGFAAGIFHFTIPYEKIKHCLTATGSWCIGLDD